MIKSNEPLYNHINQNGVIGRTKKKLEQFKLALNLRCVPKLYSQENAGDAAVVYVKFFDPSGSWSWFVTEWDGEDECFGLVKGNENELGYFLLSELNSIGGIGIEIDVHFLPKSLGEVKRKEV